MFLIINTHFKEQNSQQPGPCTVPSPYLLQAGDCSEERSHLSFTPGSAGRPVTAFHHRPSALGQDTS